MTAAQRATLEGLYLAHAVRSSADDREAADALRAALGTCGSCEHADTDEAAGFVMCAAKPVNATQFPFIYRLMRVDQRCTGYTPKEGA